jgi:hypothetical protein
MRKSISKLFCFCLLWIPTQLVAAAAEKAGGVVIVADSRHLTGLRAWWANLYNESHLYFSLLTILVIPLAGIILGAAADQLMARIGIDLKSRKLRES